MQIVIEIPEKVYNALTHIDFDASLVVDEMRNSIANGTPQKIGHWILAGVQSKEDVLNDNYRFICSECKCSDIHAKSTKVPYCWKCGAKMGVDE